MSECQVKPLAGPLVAATVALYASAVEIFLPTPRNCHYLFNMRDIAKVCQSCSSVCRCMSLFVVLAFVLSYHQIIQGLMQADRKTCDSKLRAIKLWAHEACRTFSDRFTTIGVLMSFLVECPLLRVCQCSNVCVPVCQCVWADALQRMCHASVI